jgi:hypothetical protein
VGLRGGLADDERARDLEVRRALREQLEDLALARGELRQGGREVVLARGEPGERLDDATGDRGRQHGLALVDDLDRRDELLRRGVLEEEAARAGAQPVVDVLVEIEGREDEDARGGLHRREASGRLEPVDVGHPDVHQRDVGSKAPDGGHGLLPVGGFAEDLDARLLVEQGAKARPHHGLIVGDDDADGHALGIGRTARTTNPPPPSPGPVASEPP